jgi:UDP-N-acetylmuramate dehydrogenase
MQVLENVSLKPYNTFGIDCSARYFAIIESRSELRKIYAEPEFLKLPKLILGGGSNILFCSDFEGLVLKIDLKGIEELPDGSVKVQAGENWHDFVLWSLSNGYNGLENLSLIPGNVGTAPMQNIGAYGVELKDVFMELEAFHIGSEEVHVFSKSQCEFGYRESVFKSSRRGEYVILSVRFNLATTAEVDVRYGAISSVLENQGIVNPSPKQVSNAVISIRQSKLPDPKKIGNSGSFFKNPVILKSDYLSLQEQYAEIPSYPINDVEVKVPAGWLIEKAGWKGKVIDNYGVHKSQALVLVNYGGAKGDVIYQLAKNIQESVKSIFDIHLHMEVNIIK